MTEQHSDKRADQIVVDHRTRARDHEATVLFHELVVVHGNHAKRRIIGAELDRPMSRSGVVTTQ